ncbi:reverse transcriptase domain-containing protein [Algoriphagus halophilus]|uniref:reverse transcriptase domain-containing protein n=1 Tax=Algoriphagus halophilus TaxID=226505 RepID=UPI00358E2CB7
MKCPTTLWLIRKMAESTNPDQRKTAQTPSRKGMPQGSPLVLFYPIYYWTNWTSISKSKGLKFVRYADDFSIYTQSKSAAQKVGNEVYMFLKNRLDLPINSGEKAESEDPLTLSFR